MLFSVMFVGFCAQIQPVLGVWCFSVPAEGCWPPEPEHPCETHSEKSPECVICISFGHVVPW